MRHVIRPVLSMLLLSAAAIETCSQSAHAQRGGDDGNIAAIGTAITYQGVLKQSGSAFSGICDLQFSLWTAASSGTQIGSTQTFAAQTIVDGQVTAAPDFGTLAFDGNDRWLQIAVRSPAGSGAYVTLTPRQKIGAVPYALFSVGGNTGFALAYSASFTSSTQDGLTITNLFGGGGGTSGRLGGPGYGIVGKNNASGNLGYIGHADYGVFGIAAGGTDYGVRGHHEASGNHGILGLADYGVYGHAVATTSFAVYGENAATGTNGRLGDGVAGVDGLALIDNGRPGVRGYHSPTGNYGQLGHPDYGVDGVAAGAEDTGVRGYHGPTGNYGSLGRAGQAIYFATGSQGVNAGSSGELGTLDYALRVFHLNLTTTTEALGNAMIVEYSGGNAFGTPSGGNIAVFKSNLGGGAPTTRARIANTGFVYAQQYFTSGADLAEAIAPEGNLGEYAAGDVLIISTDTDRCVKRSCDAYSTLVAGVFATKPGLVLSEDAMGNPLAAAIPVGVVGVIPTKITVENGSIRRGDLLVTSSTPGHAMKGTDRDRMLGAILGKALENFDGADGQTTGVIKVMVNCK